MLLLQVALLLALVVLADVLQDYNGLLFLIHQAVLPAVLPADALLLV